MLKLVGFLWDTEHKTAAVVDVASHECVNMYIDMGVIETTSNATLLA